MTRPSVTHLRDGRLLLPDGRVVPGDLVIEGRKLALVGLCSTVVEADSVVDLGGRLVLPGFIDGHLHLEKIACDSEKLTLAGAWETRDILNEIRNGSEVPPQSGWVVNYDEDGAGTLDRMRERALPSQAELDLVAPNVPVLLTSGGAQATLNSCALEWMRTRCSDISCSRALASYGETDNLITDVEVIRALRRAIPLPSFEARKDLVSSAAHVLNGQGLVAVVDPGHGLIPFEESLRLYRELAVEERLSLRIHLMARFPIETQCADAAAFLEAQGGTYRPGRWIDSNARIGFGGIKLIADGEIKTGWFRPEQGFRHSPRKHVDPAGLVSLATDAARSGVQLGIHALGGAAMDMVFEAFRQANRVRPVRSLRWSVIHGFFPSQENAKLAKDLGIVVSIQSPLVHAYASEMLEAWPAAMAASVNPVDTWLGTHVPISAGSDTFETSPLLGLRWLHTRETAAGAPLGAEHGISRKDAVHAYTAGGAYLTFGEKQRGALAEGMKADLVVLETDILSCPVQDLEPGLVSMVFFDGMQQEEVCHAGAE